MAEKSVPKAGGCFQRKPDRSPERTMITAQKAATDTGMTPATFLQIFTFADFNDKSGKS
jgi:hypothetical protein